MEKEAIMPSVDAVLGNEADARVQRLARIERA